MKNVLTTLFTVVLFTLLFSTTVSAQFTSNAYARAGDTGLKITFAGTIDSTGASASDSLTSNMFTLEDYDGTLNLQYWYEHSKDTTNVFVMSSRNNVDFTVTDTLVINNTTNTQVGVSVDLNGTEAPYYKLLFVGGFGADQGTFDDLLYETGKD